MAAQGKSARIPAMNDARFGIFEAAKNAYVFIGREWLALLKAGLIPMGVQAALSFFIEFGLEKASLLEGYLWSLPAAALFGWFAFIQTRLLLLGERVETLPKDTTFLLMRDRAMKACVISSLLFNMGISAALAALVASGEWAQQAGGKSLPATVASLFLIGAVFWGMRFSALPILAAVHYPFQPYIRRVRGMMFSLRLFGLGVISLFPVAILFQIFTTPFVAAATAGQATDAARAGLIIVTAPLSLLIAMVLNAALAFALKEVLGKD